MPFDRFRRPILALLATLALAAPAAATQLALTQLSNNSVEDSGPQVSEPFVAWQRSTRENGEIRFFDGVSTINVTSNAIRDFAPRISGDHVIWKHSLDGFVCDLLLWDGVSTSTVDDGFDCAEDIRVAGDHVIWNDAGALLAADVFLFDGASTDQFGDELKAERQPRVGEVGGSPRAIWHNDDGAWYYDGTNDPFPLGSDPAQDPEIDGANAVWVEDDGTDFDLFFFDGVSITQITNDGVNDNTPDVAGPYVVWVAAQEIWLWDGVSATRLTDDAENDHSPRVSIGSHGPTVAWIKEDGDGEIWVHDGCEATPLTDDGDEDGQVALDGNTVAWVSGTGDAAEVWMAQFECDSVCGDGIVEGPEDCDDGDTAVGDGCDESCFFEVCGNGILQVGEECDDGNTVPEDLCDENCLLECGNGVVEPLEECDDGNSTSGDGCDVNCLEEICGNGRVEANEECDDGNTAALDGCDAVCLLECGNGALEPAEDCDDGNLVDGDGCDAMCIAEVCGNGVLQVGEDCDDGNLVDGDGCSAFCQVEAPPSKLEQKCINEMNKRGAQIVKNQNKENLACLKSAAKGKAEKLGTPATAQGCLTNDPKGKIAKSRTKTASGEAKKCNAGDLPDFAYTNAATVNAAGTGEAVALMADLFGPDLDAALLLEAVDPVGARCQQEVVKRSHKLLDTIFKLSNKEKKRLLAGKPDGTTALSNSVLGAQLLGYVQSDAKGKIAAKAGQLADKTASRCAGVAVTTAFPGCAPAGVVPLSDCAARASRCRFCRALNDMDGLTMDCDDLDDGTANASCP